MRATTRLHYLIRTSLFLFFILFVVSIGSARATYFNSKSAKAYYYFILSELTNNAKLKEKFLLKAIKLDPYDKYLKKELALIYLGTNRVQRAKEILESLLKKYPHDVELNLLLAKLYLFEGKPDKAKKILEKIKVKAPKNEEILRLLISLY